MIGRFFFLTGCVLLAGCSETIQNHGWVGEQSAIQTAKKTKRTRAEVQRFLGAPTLTSAFNPHDVYYISYQTKQSVSFLRPTVMAYHAHKFSFSPQGKLQKVQSFGPEAQLEITPLSRETPTHGYDAPLFKQIFRNLGQLGNKQKL